MIGLEFIYQLMGVMLLGIAIVNFVDKGSSHRWRNGVFWGIYAITFLAGSYLPDRVSGVLVLVMVVVATMGVRSSGDDGATRDARERNATIWRNKLFIPVLVVPVGTLIGTFAFKGGGVIGFQIMDPKQVTLISLGLSTLLALIVGVVMLRPRLTAPIVEGRRLMDSVGWAAVLPQSLAALGAVFAAAGVGNVIAQLAGDYLPLGSPFAVVATYAIGMAMFTIIMGNAFAAFPVMTAGIGLPLIVAKFGGDVIAMSAIGMLSGFCGTLMTPMAANFNIVPAALLELRDRNGVIKAQIPTALMLLTANIFLMYIFVFRAR